MKDQLRYRGHNSVASKLRGLLRLAFCVFAVGFSLASIIQGLRTGQLEAPLRAAHLIVTTASPAWFAVILLAYCLMAALFAVGSYASGKQLLEDIRA